jgi:hypothetical protein
MDEPESSFHQCARGIATPEGIKGQDKSTRLISILILIISTIY